MIPGVIINPETNEYSVHCEAGSLGDMLAATAIFKNGRKGTVYINDDPRCREFGTIFNGLCEVKHLPTILYPLPLAGVGPHSRQVLTALGINDYGTPYVAPDYESLAWAEKWLKQHKNPIVVCGTVSGNPEKHLRKIDPSYMQWIVDRLVLEGFTPLSFGDPQAFQTFNGCVSTMGIGLAKIAAIYKLVGKYVGVDSGDYHLMLAVGGQCITLVPDSCPEYNYRIHHYTPEDFPNGRPRVQYLNFRDYRKIFLYNFGIKITVYEGYAFDMLSVLKIKLSKNPNDTVIDDSHYKLEHQMVEAVGEKLVKEVIESPEFANLTAANERIFNRIVEMRGRERTGEDAKYIDDNNYERFLAKNALQEKFFPNSMTPEKKFGYDDPRRKFVPTT